MAIDISKTEARVRRLIAKKEWSAAAAAQLELARAIATDIEAWAEVVRLRRAAHEDEQAIWDEAAKLNENNMAVELKLWRAIAQWHGEASRWGECIAVCDAILHRDPRHHDALEMRSAAQLHAGDVGGAIGTLRILLRISPRDPLHRLKLATLLQVNGETADAAREYERVLAAHPDAPFTGEARGALEMLDNLQMHQVLMRAAEDLNFRRHAETSLDEALSFGGYYLSPGARETLRQNLADGRPEAPPSAPRVH